MMNPSPSEGAATSIWHCCYHTLSYRLPIMAGFLALPNEVIELTGMRVIRRRNGIRKWCRLTTTCKRLWDMQLPGSASEWSVDLNVGMKRKSKTITV